MKNPKFIFFILFIIQLCLTTNNLLSFPARTCIFPRTCVVPSTFLFGDLHTNSKKEKQTDNDFKKTLEQIDHKIFIILAETSSEVEHEFWNLTELLHPIFIDISLSETPTWIKKTTMIKSSNDKLIEKGFKYYCESKLKKLPEAKLIKEGFHEGFLSLLGKKYHNELFKRFTIIEIDNFRRPFLLLEDQLNYLEYFCMFLLNDPSLLLNSNMIKFIESLNQISPSISNLKQLIYQYKIKLKQIKEKISPNNKNILEHIDHIYNNLENRSSELISKFSTNINSMYELINYKLKEDWINRPITQIFHNFFRIVFLNLVENLIENKDTNSTINVMEEFFYFLIKINCLFTNYVHEPTYKKNYLTNEVNNSLDYHALNIILDPKYIDHKFLIFSGRMHTLNIRELLIGLKVNPILDIISTNQKDNKINSDDFRFNKDNVLESTNHSKYFSLILKNPEEIENYGLIKDKLSQIFQPHSGISDIIQDY